MSKNREKTVKNIKKSQKCFKPENEREKYGKRSQKFEKSRENTVKNNQKGKKCQKTTTKPTKISKNQQKAVKNI